MKTLVKVVFSTTNCGLPKSIEEYFQKPLGQVFEEHGYSGVIEAYNRDALEWGEATI